MVEYVKTYSCPTCRGQASGRGHLCHPLKEGVPFVCDFCGKKVDDARHVCGKMIDNIEYICKKCGRLTVYDSLVCQPELIDKD